MRDFQARRVAEELRKALLAGINKARLEPRPGRKRQHQCRRCLDTCDCAENCRLCPGCRDLLRQAERLAAKENPAIEQGLSRPLSESFMRPPRDRYSFGLWPSDGSS